MPLSKLPVTDLDNINHRRRARETINQVLDHSFDDSKVQTPAEIAAGVTPINKAYPPGYVDRYGTNTTPGTTDMTAAFNAAFKVAKNSGFDVVYGSTWPYLLTGPIDATQDAGSDQYGYSVRNIGHTAAFTTNAPGYASILANHTGHVFDCAGAILINWHDVSVGTITGGNEPKTVWFCARNSAGSSSTHRWFGCSAIGTFSKTIRALVATETTDAYGDFLYNESTAAGTSCESVSSNNILGLSSTFITIYSTANSQRAVRHHGGSYINLSSDAAADVFQLDQVENWYSRDAFVACNGRSIVFADPTNGPSNYCHISGMEVENGVEPTYAICFGAASSTSQAIGWSITDSYLRADTRAIYAGTNVVLDQFQINSITEAANKGIEVVTLMVGGAIIDTPIVRVIGESRRTLHVGQSDSWTFTTRTDDPWIEARTSKTWSANTSALTITNALTTNRGISEFHGRRVTVNLVLVADVSIVCAAGVQITGLPATPVEVSAEMRVVNSTTGAEITGGYVGGAGLVLPAINVLTDQITITATYFAT
jgi:hypothetical protein